MSESIKSGILASGRNNRKQFTVVGGPLKPDMARYNHVRDQGEAPTRQIDGREDLSLIQPRQSQASRNCSIGVAEVWLIQIQTFFGGCNNYVQPLFVSVSQDCEQQLVSL
jgi:hypothetical protein